MSRRFERNIIKFLELLHYSEEIGTTGKFVKKYFKRRSEYEHLINYLERKKFITKIIYEGVSVFQMTDAGIEFLLERKKEKRQEEFNKIIAMTAAVLALISLYDFFKELNIVNTITFIIFLCLMIFSFFMIVDFVAKNILGKI